MVDWMGEDNLIYCRVILLCHKYERVKYNIVIIFGPRVLDLGFWSLDFYIKSESLFIVFIHCMIIVDRYSYVVYVREDSASFVFG